MYIFFATTKNSILKVLPFKDHRYLVHPVSESRGGWSERHTQTEESEQKEFILSNTGLMLLQSVVYLIFFSLKICVGLHHNKSRAP